MRNDQRRRRNIECVGAEKKVCAEFKFVHMRSGGRHFTWFEARVMKWERFGILAVLVAAVYLIASWLAKH